MDPQKSVSKKALFDKSFSSDIIAGIDEAGRGPLAGPVVACACILQEDIEGVDDSKRLTADKRERLYQRFLKSRECFFSFSIVDNKKIDEINILQATFLAMREAVEKLKVRPKLLLVDGKYGPTFGIPSKNIIRGDTLSLSIAAASIIAKVIRDRIMDDYDKIWPKYGFSKHKGYPTREHKEAIVKMGIVEIHRKSFMSFLGR